LKLELLAAPRSSHAPAAYHLADSALDAWLWRRGDDTGVTRIQDPTHGDAAIAPMAQAGNGGAVIDEFGRTTVSGLLAAGECATGMHGANRLGGAMVTATQVFGARAGMVAAEDASAGPQPRESEVRAAFDAFMGRGVVHDPKERTDVLSWLGTILSTHALDLDRAASAELAAATDKRLAHTSDHHARLALETAGLILSGRLEAAAAGADQEPAPHAGAAPGDS
jgi:L-aspartate oxidase